MDLIALSSPPEAPATNGGLPLHSANTMIAGHEISTLSRTELTDLWANDCLGRRQTGFDTGARLVFDVNGHGLSLAHTDQDYFSAVQKADLLHADGGFLVTASRRTGTPIAERSATTDMLHDFARHAEAHDLSFYLLGATEAVNRDCAAELQRLYPRLRIVGRRNGYFSRAEEAGIIGEINAVRPDVLWVGLGKPNEQYFAVRNARALRAGWLVTCGGCFNYVTGAYKRAPAWMQRSNLEWLHRMATNRKLVWRYLTTTPHALWLVLKRSGRDARVGVGGDEQS